MSRDRYNTPQALARRFLMVASIVTLTSCSSLATFEITETAEAHIEKGSLLEQLVGSMGFGDFLSMDVTANQELQNSGVQKRHIESVSLQSLTLVIVDPAQDQGFDFIESLEFSIDSPGSEPARIAYGGPFEETDKSVELSVESVELAPYATDASMDITTDVTGRRPDHDTTVEAQMVLEVVAKLF